MPNSPGLSAIVPQPPPTPAVGPSAPLHNRIVRLKRSLSTYIYVEDHGFYSLEKLLAFQKHTKRERWQQLGILLLSALPTVFIVVALELLVLDDPTLGWKQNPTFFIRETVRAWILGMAGNVQFQQIIPTLRQPWYLLLLIGFLQIVPYTASLLGIAAWVNVFPVPFSNVVPILPVVVVAVGIRYCFLRTVLAKHPDIKPAYERLERLLAVTFSLLIVYSVYGFAFRQVSASYQVLLSFVLFGIKYGIQRRMRTHAHAVTDRRHDDHAAVTSVCGVHLFHALFVTSCLQSARSSATLAIVLVLGTVHDLLSVRAIRRLSSQVSAVIRSFEHDFCAGTFCNPFAADWTAAVLLHADTPTVGEPDARNQASQLAKSNSVEHLAAMVSGGDLRTVGDRKARVTHAIARLMHGREAVLLRLLVDIFVPLLYLTHVGLLVFWPTSNRPYFANLTDVDDHAFGQLAVHIAILVASKVLVLTALCGLLHSRRQPSGLHQLVFVVSSQRWTMQSWLVMSVLQIINFPLTHMGNDLTFQFKWITGAS